MRYPTWPSRTCCPPAWKSRTRASAPSATLAWATDAAQSDYLDVRDDRLNLFTTATVKPKVFYYLARAVSRGTFKLGPVSADAMYNAAYHSYAGAGVVRVR